mmetsp:Transcript_62297/g.103590  ORF Transcript_62297/g.103590 Transcript_62297/m.103590 type:complete len:332 (+) Transcript_62297:35-1030(+)
MPLTAIQLEDLQAEYLADDVTIDFERMSLWSEAQARTYFESGGQDPVNTTPAPSFTRGGNAPTGTTPWLRCLQKKPSARFRCIVFNWTGNRGGQGSAHNISRAPCNWSQSLSDFEVYEVALPGRGTRMKDVLCKDARTLVKQIAEACAKALSGGTAYAFVGFSFGSIIAWEVALAINESHAGEGPALVVAASAEGPSWPQRAGTQHALDESQFQAMLRGKGGTDFILKDPGMTKMYVPVIRADMQLEETYVPLLPERCVCVPIFAFFGEKPGRDKEATRVSRDDASLWLAATHEKTTSCIVPIAESDWYLFQDEKAVRALHEMLCKYFDAL